MRLLRSSRARRAVPVAGSVLTALVTALTIGGPAAAPAAVRSEESSSAAVRAGHPGGSAQPSSAQRARPPRDFDLVGNVTIPTGEQYAGTEVGGLSGIVYDRRRGVYYAISDDRSEKDPARFYTLRIDLRDRKIDRADIEITDVTTLRRSDGTPFPPLSLDPEGIALTKRRTLLITSEGDVSRGIDPFVREFALDGRQLRAFRVPRAYLPSGDGTRGVRNNLAFESASITRGGRFLFTASENALVQDGPAADLGVRSPSRILRYNARTGKPERQFRYVTAPVAEAPVPPEGFRTNGLAELLALSPRSLLALERSFSVGAGNTIRLYRAELRDGRPGGRLRPIGEARKRLLLDFDALGVPLDNLEGMTFGPRLPGGRRSLIVVSDNNFSPTQFTQVLVLSVR